MKDINKLLAFTAIAEAATGVALMVAPALVGQLLLDVELSGAGVVVGRIAGLALIALGLACWPGGREARALCGMLTYNTLATLFLAYLGRVGEWAGPLLWPAVGLHGSLAVLLARAWLIGRMSPTKNHQNG